MYRNKCTRDQKNSIIIHLHDMQITEGCVSSNATCSGEYLLSESILSRNHLRKALVSRFSCSSEASNWSKPLLPKYPWCPEDSHRICIVEVLPTRRVFLKLLTGLVTHLFFKDYGRGIKMYQKLYFDGVSHGRRSQKYHFGHPSQHHCWDCKMAGDRHWFWAFLSKQINQLFVESQHSALYWHNPLFMVNILAGKNFLKDERFLSYGIC